jgi:hypothetical protein
MSESHPEQLGRFQDPHAQVYKSQRWVDLRARVLKEEPVCAVPGCQERSISVDHIVSLGNGGNPFDMMTAGEMLAYERYKAGKRKYPGADRLSFRDTGKGWAVRPDYTPRLPARCDFSRKPSGVVSWRFGGHSRRH